MSTRTKWVALVAILLICISASFIFLRPVKDVETVLEENKDVEIVEDQEVYFRQTVLGQSVEGRNIIAYHYGTGDKELLFVGGIHGGYEWNSSLLAYETADHFSRNVSVLPKDITITIIPVLNPDGLYMVTGLSGYFTTKDVRAVSDSSVARFNANNVDLNRNFDCNWESESTWRGNKVSAGTEAFSEPEAAALRDYVLSAQPEVVVFWHSQANTVYASECNEGVLPETLLVMSTYADAAGYLAIESFDAYPITGDAEGWLASIGIPAVTVELATHESIEFVKNLAGVESLVNLLSVEGAE